MTRVFSPRRRLVPALALFAALAGLSCSDERPEWLNVTSSKRIEGTFRDGSRIDVHLFQMTRSYRSKGGLLSGLDPPRMVYESYLDLDGEVRTSAGAVVGLGWTSRDREALGRAGDDPEVQVQPARLAVAGSEVFLELLLLPGRPPPWPGGAAPSAGEPDTRYLRLAGPRLWPFLAPDEPRYAWKAATREQFERAAQAGGATEVDDGTVSGIRRYAPR